MSVLRENLPVVPLRGLVVLPGEMLHFDAGRTCSVSVKPDAECFFDAYELDNPFVPPNPTNADRIRKTTDEELAKMLAYNDVFYEEICGSDERTRVCDNDCVACTLEWLRQRAKEEHYETD